VLSDVPALAGELCAVLARLAALDPAGLADPSLLAGLSELYDAETLLRSVQTRWLAAADAREVTVAIAGRAARSWLVEDCQLGGRDASARLRLARTMGAFPVVEAAFAAARVTAEQAGAIVTALADVPADARGQVERLLVDRAGEFGPFALSRLTDALIAELGGDTASERAEAARQRRLARRGVDLDATFDGTGSLAGTLTADVHDTVHAALAAASLAAGPEDDRTPRQRRHDALGEVCAHYLTTRATAAVINGERPRVVVTITATDLANPAGTGWGRLDSGLPIPADTARRLACDAQILAAVIGGDGEVLRLGRTTRTWTPAIRRAAWIRDHGRCAYPRCRRPPADLHHITWWTHGGNTDLHNAAWLCNFHHWLIHERHWTIHRTTGNRYVFTPPSRHQATHPPPRQREPA
jgi:hypothetical protein